MITLLSINFVGRCWDWNRWRIWCCYSTVTHILTMQHLVSWKYEYSVNQISIASWTYMYYHPLGVTYNCIVIWKISIKDLTVLRMDSSECYQTPILFSFSFLWIASCNKWIWGLGSATTCLCLEWGTGLGRTRSRWFNSSHTMN